MKKVTACVLSILLLFSIVRPCAADDGISAGAYVLMCADNGEIAASRRENERMPIASLTKIMTAVVTLENADLDRSVTIPAEACGIEGSSVYLSAGEKLTVRDLLYALMLESANDAAVAIAYAVSGSVDAFVCEMNACAEKIGLEDTRFSNPHGLDAEGHYSTAYDLAMLTRYALALPAFREIVFAASYRIPYKGAAGGRYLVNHNRMVTTYDGCIGVKTGYTKKSGRCLVTAAERNGVTLIAVTLSDPDDWRDHAALLDLGFSTYIRRDLVVGGESVSINVVSGMADTVVCAAEPLSCVMRRDSGDVQCITQTRRFYYAPLCEGETVGYLVFRYGDEIIARSRVYSCSSVAAVTYKMSIFEIIRCFFR